MLSLLVIRGSELTSRLLVIESQPAAAMKHLRCPVRGVDRQFIPPFSQSPSTRHLLCVFSTMWAGSPAWLDLQLHLCFPSAPYTDDVFCEKFGPKMKFFSQKS